jgi:hypothetical protein
MKFIKTFASSIYDPEFFSRLSEIPFRFSMKYFFKFALFFALVATAVISFRILPGIYEFIFQIKPTIVSSFPKDLEVKIQDGTVMTNVQEPYFIKYPNSLDSQNGSLMPPENLIVIDTQSNSLDDLKKYNTMVLVTRNNLIVRNQNTQIEVYSMEKFPNVKINQDLLTSNISKIDPYIKLIGIVITIFVFLGICIALMFELLYLFFLALLIWVVVSIKKISWNYSKSYQAGLHLITLPIILQYTLSRWINIPFFFTIVAVLLAVANIRKNSENSPQVLPVPKPISQQ